MIEDSLRSIFPLSWQFHANTMRWAHNVEPPPEDVLPSDPRENPALPLRSLPPPAAPADQLGAVISARYSCRRFAEEPIAIEALGNVLHAGYGIHDVERSGRLEFATRPVPSGGGLYPLELNLICRNMLGLLPGIYHYVAEYHAVECLNQGAVPKAFLDYLFMGQSSLTAAPALVVLSGEWQRSMRKYGDRGYRYVLIEAGHVMQNINLACVQHGLASCNIGGFFDVELAHLLKIDPEREAAIYACAIGLPAGSTKMEMRDL